MPSWNHSTSSPPRQNRQEHQERKRSSLLNCQEALRWVSSMGDQKLETSLTQSIPLPSIKEADLNHGKRVSTMGVPSHPTLSLAPPCPWSPLFQVTWFFIFLPFPGTLPASSEEEEVHPHPFLSLADPRRGDNSFQQHQWEWWRECVLMLIQSAGTACSVAVWLTNKPTSPTQGLTFLGDYPVLTCVKSVALLLLEKLGSHSFRNISPCQYCTKKHWAFSWICYCIMLQEPHIDSEMALSAVPRRDGPAGMIVFRMPQMKEEGGGFPVYFIPCIFVLSLWMRCFFHES